MRKIAGKAALGIVGAALLAAGLAVAKEDRKPIERFQAFSASLQRGKTAVIDIVIFRWSTDEERDRLLTTLQEFGQDRLLSELQKIRPIVGHISTTGTLGWDIFYARNYQNPDGSRRVVFATNRRVAFGEAASNTRSMQYQFTLGEMHLDAARKGDGKLVPMAKVSWNKDQHKLEIENYNALPVDMLNVTAKKP